MTKLLMMIALACTVQALAVFAQGPKSNDLQPPYIDDKVKFEEYFENERMTIRYRPRLVCTKADAPRPGTRFYYGACAENFRMRIPFDNSPAWDCEQTHGVGNCRIVQFPSGTKLTIRSEDGMFDQKMDPYYVPTCKQDFRHFFVWSGRYGDVGEREYGLYCGRQKQEDK